MHISVVVPFLNAEPFIGQCLDALLSQDYPVEQYEIIMVDNNSTDASASIVRRSPRVRLLAEARQSAYAARNRGIRQATGDVIAFTDPDCVPARDWLTQIAQGFASPGVQMIQGESRFASESFVLSALSDYEACRAAYIYSEGPREVYYGYCNNLAIRRRVFARIGLFPEVTRGGDTILVHHVVDEYSRQAVQFRPAIGVRHLEIDSALAWCRKMRVYGRSGRHYGRILFARPLNTRERLRVFRDTMRSRRNSLARSATLFALLAAGVVSYELGRLFPGLDTALPAHDPEDRRADDERAADLM